MLAAKPVKAQSPTLGMELHIKNKRKSGGKGSGPCSENSIRTLQRGIKNHLEKWLDKPNTEITGIELNKLHDKIIKDYTTKS